ncbi:site-specific recombinase [Psychrobacter pygoscelis]|uniref:site-specific recombinase n=1 Tax=Psychrobacter pygoscelis TaxID=2488563 RepID=UPI0010407561|nr:site-specific recombinase [Psychrobacter pygoscelis]
MSELKRILQQITALSEVPEPSVLKRLIDELRVHEKDEEKSSKAANEKIQSLIDLLQEHPEYGAGLAAFTLKLLNQYQQVSLFTDTGILSDQGFVSSLNRLVGHRFLPLLPQEDDVVELIDYLFDDRHDERWLASIDDTLWDTLVDLIQMDEAHVDLVATAKNNLLNAMIILSYRISGIGLHPELMKAYPQMLGYSAAFVAQNQEAVLFVNQYRQAHKLDDLKDVIPENDISTAPLLVMLEQCEDIVTTIRKRIYKTGISIRITNMLLRLEQSLERMRILSELLADDHKNRDKAIIQLTEGVISSARRRYSIGYLINTNTNLLSRKVTENASRVGEHYISTDKAGYKNMFKKASIGGFVIAFMATIKIEAYNLVLAPIGRAFVNSMIYGLGFVFIHVIHGTVATKQPAMTAAAIASTISQGSGKKSHQLTKLSELIVDILRTQFVAIMGNVLIAMPVTLAISIAWMQISGTPMINSEKAMHLLHELDPFRSLALPHAAIAGVFLFLSGLIAGYYDNLAVYNHIGARISRHWLLKRLMPHAWLERLSSFIETNLGAIMGNFLFGVFLGSTATIGYILGLPLDIRHIAFSSANFVHGLFNMPADQFSLSIVLTSILGVALIGIVNLAVSFSLALIVALRAKDVQFLEWGRLARLLLTHLFTHPKDFFWPRPEPMQYARIDSQGHMIFEEVSGKKGGKPMPTNYVIRRLSDVKAMPENKQHKPTDTASESAHNDMETKILEDGLVDDDIMEATPLADDHQDKTGSNNEKAGQAKSPLPKPSKPPKLPD